MPKVKHIVTYNNKADELRIENVNTKADDGNGTQRTNELVFCNFSQLDEAALREAWAYKAVIQAQIPMRLAGDTFLKKNTVIRRSALKPGAKISSPETVKRELIAMVSTMTPDEARKAAAQLIQQAELMEATK